MNLLKTCLSKSAVEVATPPAAFNAVVPESTSKTAAAMNNATANTDSIPEVSSAAVAHEVLCEPTTTLPALGTLVVEGEGGPVKWYKVAAVETLVEGGRVHVVLEGRYVTVLRIDGGLTCIDSVCFHAGGPLGIGDIEDVAGKKCLVCPWHYYKIDIHSGDKLYQTLSWVDGKPVPGEWKSNGPKQRIHPSMERGGFIYVSVDTKGNYESDEHAVNVKCGERVITGGVQAANRRLAMVGGDGKRT